MKHPSLVAIIHTADEGGPFQTVHAVREGETVEELALRLMASMTKEHLALVAGGTDTKITWHYWHGATIELKWVVEQRLEKTTDEVS